MEKRLILLVFIGISCWGVIGSVRADEAQAGDTKSESRVRAKTTPPDAADREWPRLLGKDFESVAVGVPTTINLTAAPKEVWSIDVGDGYGIGSVADQRYFHFDAIADPNRPGGIMERLRAFEWTDGKLIWENSRPTGYRDLYGYESGPRSVPTIAGDLIYTMGVAGDLVCRNQRDGTVAWSASTSSDFSVVQNFFGVGGSPLVVDDQVIVMVGGSPPTDAAIAPGRLDRVSATESLLVSFDRKTGDKQWECGSDLASYSSPRTITLQTKTADSVEPKTFVLMFGRAALWMVDPETGTVQWKHDHRADILESVNAMIPVVSGDEVFISECYEIGSKLLRVTPTKADVIWEDPARDRRRQSMRCHWSTPIRIGDSLYGCSGRNAPDCDFRCIDWRTGDVQWKGLERQRSSVTLVNDQLLVWDERARATILKATADRMQVVTQWSLDGSDAELPKLNYPCWSAPVVIGNRVLLRGDQTVVCMQWD